jgi:hypothetical protein
LYRLNGLNAELPPFQRVIPFLGCDLHPCAASTNIFCDGNRAERLSDSVMSMYFVWLRRRRSVELLSVYSWVSLHLDQSDFESIRDAVSCEDRIVRYQHSPSGCIV